MAKRSVIGRRRCCRTAISGPWRRGGLVSGTATTATGLWVWASGRFGVGGVAIVSRGAGVGCGGAPSVGAGAGGGPLSFLHPALATAASRSRLGRPIRIAASHRLAVSASSRSGQPGQVIRGSEQRRHLNPPAPEIRGSEGQGERDPAGEHEDGKSHQSQQPRGRCGSAPNLHDGARNLQWGSSAHIPSVRIQNAARNDSWICLPNDYKRLQVVYNWSPGWNCH